MFDVGLLMAAGRGSLSLLFALLEAVFFAPKSKNGFFCLLYVGSSLGVVAPSCIEFKMFLTPTIRTAFV